MAETFYLHNTTRSPQTAGVRRQLTADLRSKKNIIIGGGTVSVRRGRPMPVAEALVRQHSSEITQLVANGLLKVTNGRQEEIDVSTMKSTGRTVSSAELKPVEEPVKAAPQIEPPPPALVPTPEPTPEPELEAAPEPPPSEEVVPETEGEDASTGKRRRRGR